MKRRQGDLRGVDVMGLLLILAFTLPTIWWLTCHNSTYFDDGPCFDQGIETEAWDELYQCGYEPVDCPALTPGSEAAYRCQMQIHRAWDTGDCAAVDAALEYCHALEAP